MNDMSPEAKAEAFRLLCGAIDALHVVDRGWPERGKPRSILALQLVQGCGRDLEGIADTLRPRALED